jgi:hypothetical protein
MEGSRVFGGLAQPETMLKHTNMINSKNRKPFLANIFNPPFSPPSPQRGEGGAFYKSLITESPLLIIPAPVFTGLNSSRNPDFL